MFLEYRLTIDSNGRISSVNQSKLRAFFSSEHIFTMEELLQCLQSLDNSDLPNSCSGILNGDKKSIIHRISALASVVLITDEGLNILENHRYLESNGFPVFPGEQDSMGWLSGCIQTKKGIIVYG